jgi:hypothetical protein
MARMDPCWTIFRRLDRFKNSSEVNRKTIRRRTTAYIFPGIFRRKETHA